VHNWFGFLLLGNFALWAVYYLLSGKLKVYLPDPNLKNFVLGPGSRPSTTATASSWRSQSAPRVAGQQVQPMQQVAYFNIMLLFMPLQIVTGILMWDIKRFAPVISFAGGIKTVDTVHVFLTLFFTAFLSCTCTWPRSDILDAAPEGHVHRLRGRARKRPLWITLSPLREGRLCRSSPFFFLPVAMLRSFQPQNNTEYATVKVSKRLRAFGRWRTVQTQMASPQAQGTQHKSGICFELKVTLLFASWRLCEKQACYSFVRSHGAFTLAGKPAPKELLVDLAQARRGLLRPDADVNDPRQLVAFGTSGHRGSSLRDLQ